jgi:peptidyl-prolyl cis-trans isomerase C
VREPSRLHYALLLLLVAICPSCAPTEPAGDPVLLTLGDQVVRLSEFERHVAKIEEQGEAPLDADVRRALLQPFLEERVLVLEARRQGLLGPEADETEEDAGVRRLLASSVLRRVAVPEEAVDAYYSTHGDEFQVPETVTVRQILVPTRNEARDVRRRLQKAPRSFDALARSLSQSPEADQGGLMGTFSRGQLPKELEAAAFGLRPGAISGVVETPLGYHVLRVDSRQDPRQVPLEECRDQIRSGLLQVESDRRVREFVRDIMAEAQVNHEVLEDRPGSNS